MGIEDELAKNAESTVRRSDISGGHVKYLTYNMAPSARGPAGRHETYVIEIRLPKEATEIALHGPGRFTKRGKGDIYGVRITFVEQGKDVLHTRTIELPHPVADVQLLDRKPDEAYKAVA